MPRSLPCRMECSVAVPPNLLSLICCVPTQLSHDFCGSLCSTLCSIACSGRCSPSKLSHNFGGSQMCRFFNVTE